MKKDFSKVIFFDMVTLEEYFDEFIADVNRGQASTKAEIPIMMYFTTITINLKVINFRSMIRYCKVLSTSCTSNSKICNHT